MNDQEFQGPEYVASLKREIKKINGRIKELQSELIQEHEKLSIVQSEYRRVTNDGTWNAFKLLFMRIGNLFTSVYRDGR